MTIFYQIGPDEIGESDRGGLKWVVYHYTKGDYDGDGEAISFDGVKYYRHNLGHCSCYGPEEGINDRSDIVDLKDIVGPNVINCPVNNAIVKKVRELVGYDG